MKHGNLKKNNSVHPHVCGERSKLKKEMLFKTGSSPRVWGTDMIHRVQMKKGRFIPTCVGNG